MLPGADIHERQLFVIKEASGTFQQVSRLTQTVKSCNSCWESKHTHASVFAFRGSESGDSSHGHNNHNDASSGSDLDKMYLMLDPQLQPIEPDITNSESVQIFEQHKQIAREYLGVQTEIAFLTNTRRELSEQLNELSSEYDESEAEEMRKLENEKESLLLLHNNLKRQLELIRRQRGGHSSWMGNST